VRATANEGIADGADVSLVNSPEYSGEKLSPENERKFARIGGIDGNILKVT
jgi:hypothetical protein